MKPNNTYHDSLWPPPVGKSTLLERCAELSDEQLDTSIAGTIARFWTHYSISSVPNNRTSRASAPVKSIVDQKMRRR